MKSIFNVVTRCFILSSIFIGCKQADKPVLVPENKKTSVNKPIVEKKVEEIFLDDNELKVILGTYTSNELFAVDYADNTMGGGSICNLEIKKSKKGIVVKQLYNGNEPYGCSGPETNAEADFIKAIEVADNVYKVFITKTYCNYTDKQDCGMPEEEVDIKERNPKENAEVELTIDFSNKKKIVITSSAIKTRCKNAWSFDKLTFRKK